MHKVWHDISTSATGSHPLGQHPTRRLLRVVVIDAANWKLTLVPEEEFLGKSKQGFALRRWISMIPPRENGCRPFQEDVIEGAGSVGQRTIAGPNLFDQQVARRQMWRGVAVLLGLAICVLPLDLIVARLHIGHSSPRFLEELLTKIEPFGHAIGVALITASVAILDPARRRWAPGVCICGALAGGLSADVLKLLIARTRPRDLEVTVGTVMETFQGWLPFGTGGSALQSFPSAHTATAVGLAAGLATIYPHGRWWFVLLATLVGWHRIDSSAHFPSDVFAGAAVGWLAGNWAIAAWLRWISPVVSPTQSDRPQLRIVA
jgi:membrane-associated phospholipid phosphatase